MVFRDGRAEAVAADERPRDDRLSAARGPRRGALHAALRGRDVPALVSRACARRASRSPSSPSSPKKVALPRRARVRLPREDRRQASPREMLLELAARQAAPAGEPAGLRRPARRPRRARRTGGPSARRAEMVVLPHPDWKVAAGSLDTGVPLSIAGQLLASRDDPHARRALPRDRRADRALLRDARAAPHARAVRADESEKGSAVAIASVNPATGETLKTLRAALRGRGRAARRARRRHEFAALARGRRCAERAARWLTRRGRSSTAARPTGADRMTLEMGKPIGAGDRRGREVRLGLPLLRRERRALPGRRARRDRREPELRPLRPARPGARRHALELPVLAGLPLRGAGAHGGQRRPPEARLERSRLRPRDRGDLPRGGLSRRAPSRRSSSAPTASRGSSTIRASRP